jgi:2-phospho-L-lactate guanylyltransferase
MRTAAILPVKDFSHAKQRLRASVTNPLHTGLTRAMVDDVLAAVHACRSIERTIVVTNEQAVATAACSQGAIVVPDSAEDGQSAAVALGIESALADGIERALCIPGDCPALDPEQLEQLLDSAAPARGQRQVVIVPDRHGTGTNGLLLAPPDAIAPSFGPGSCERHEALARAAGAACRQERPSSLLLDIDTGEDLAVLRERLAGGPIGAPRTCKLLDVTITPSRAA